MIRQYKINIVRIKIVMMPLKDFNIIKRLHLLQNNVLVVVAFNIKGDSIRETDDTLHVGLSSFIYLIE